MADQTLGNGRIEADISFLIPPEELQSAAFRHIENCVAFPGPEEFREASDEAVKVRKCTQPFAPENSPVVVLILRAIL